MLHSPGLRLFFPRQILGGSWVVINGAVINGAISRVTILISRIRGLTTPLLTTHEPPSTGGLN